MLANVQAANLGAVLLVVGGLAVAYYVFERARYDMRVRRVGGVRAFQVGRDPLSATLWLVGTARAHMQNRLLERFNELVDLAPRDRPDCVEVQVEPRQRYILTRDPAHVKTVLAIGFARFGKGQLFHRLWSPFLGDSIFTTDGPLWHASRNLIRPMFARDRVSDLATFERGTAALLRRLPPSGETVDVMDLFYRLTLDVTTDFLLGASIGSLDNPQSEFAKAFNEVQNIQMLITMLGPFEALIPRWRQRRGIRVIDRFVMPYIEQALRLPRAELEKRPEGPGDDDDRAGGGDLTFLHSVAQRTRDPKVLRDQIVAVLLAGRDTTAATLSWALYELARCPAKWARLRREALDVLGGGGNGDESSRGADIQQQQQQQQQRPPTYDDLKAMPYLRHTVAEVLRLYPSVPYNLRCALEDTTLPPTRPGQPPISVVKGDIVLYSTLAMQRRSDLYPPACDGSAGLADPAVFSPERWEAWTPKAWQYVPFNGGPRICVGQNFALTEIYYCLVRLLQKYDRLEYRGDWHAQRHQAEVVGKPSLGVPVALYEAPSVVER